MITMPFMMGARAKEEVWEITVNTEATTTGAKTTGIPISLYNQPGITVSVDWGDGTNSVLTQASYTDGDYTPSTHEYATPGTYTVQMKSTKWSKLYIDSLGSSSSGTLIHLQAFRDTLVECGSLPVFKGIAYKINSTTSINFMPASVLNLFNSCHKLASISEGVFHNNDITTFSSCFNNCSSLTSIPSTLFNNNPNATSFYYCFSACSGLTSIPSELFNNNPNVTNFGYCFSYCSNITDFTLRINSSVVSSASIFVTIKSGTTRTIYVPSGSTTETTFNSVASGLGLTIIGE